MSADRCQRRGEGVEGEGHRSWGGVFFRSNQERAVWIAGHPGAGGVGRWMSGDPGKEWRWGLGG